jgi:UDP-N-acetyl-D-mannosaminuronic acid dehydrogenase
MKFTLTNGTQKEWKVEKIGVIGPGIVGMPMAALLADAHIKIGMDKPAKVVVVQRKSKNSGWKVPAINQGKSVIGGIEPELNALVEKSVKNGILSASWDYNILSDADVILIAIQTDKHGSEPDYGPLFGGLASLAEALLNKPIDKIPLIVFESTLAPSSMATMIKDFFATYNLIEGKDILLGNSPNRVMPGRLVERVRNSDKLLAGLHPGTPDLIKHLYKHIVKEGTLHITNSLTAEVVKTLENAYRDVRIAFSSEIVRYCDEQGIDFYKVRDEVNKRLAQNDNASSDPNAVPSGGILVPTVGVGGHCLPKDGILLWWRKIESGADTKQSLILKSRIINDESPAETIRLFENTFEKVNGKHIAILGAAYRFNSEDARNSPALQLALQLQAKGAHVIIHDPYVKPFDQNLVRFKLDSIFTQDLAQAVKKADYIIVGTAHKMYYEEMDDLFSEAKVLKGVFDGCNIYLHEDFIDTSFNYTGIGRGTMAPDEDFIEFVYDSFRSCEIGLANEVYSICEFLNKRYADNDFNKVQFTEVQRLAASCSTGCEIANISGILSIPVYKGFSSRLSQDAFYAQQNKPEPAFY